MCVEINILVLAIPVVALYSMPLFELAYCPTKIVLWCFVCPTEDTSATRVKLSFHPTYDEVTDLSVEVSLSGGDAHCVLLAVASIHTFVEISVGPGFDKFGVVTRVFDCVYRDGFLGVCGHVLGHCLRSL